ncbi:hypothetical protein KWE21_04130 [Acinetobacter pittii]|uniref:hypothetical protein n=1 Tax=Acinetobacter pittii TaxID=48296 RepID=UPI00355ADB21
MNKLLFTAFFCMGLIGCSNSELPKMELTQKDETKLIGSLAASSANSPESFFNDVVNGRIQFNNDVKQVNNDTFQQTIVNNTDTLGIIATWKRPKDWEMTSLSVNLNKKADADSLQVFLRFPYRLNEFNEITNILSKSASTQSNITSNLSNGATISVEENPEKINILIR